MVLFGVEGPNIQPGLVNLDESKFVRSRFPTKLQVDGPEKLSAPASSYEGSSYGRIGKLSYTITTLSTLTLSYSLCL